MTFSHNGESLFYPPLHPYGVSLVLVGVIGDAGRVKTKGTLVEHCSPHGAIVQQALTVKELLPIVAPLTSSFRLPSASATLVAGTQAGPVNLYNVTPVCGSQTRNGAAQLTDANKIKLIAIKMIRFISPPTEYNLVVTPVQPFFPA